MRKVPSLPPELSPSRYIEKVSLATGDVLADEILPLHLLVGHHRDYLPADVQARRFMSRLMKETGDEQLVTRKMKQVREIGLRASERIARALGQRDPEKISKALFGLKRKAYYFRYKRHPVSREEIEERLILPEWRGRLGHRAHPEEQQAEATEHESDDRQDLGGLRHAVAAE